VAEGARARSALEASVQALGAKLQAALREEVGLVERVQGLEADRAALEEQVAAMRAGRDSEAPEELRQQPQRTAETQKAGGEVHEQVPPGTVPCT
jgi:hypothetical protein